MNAFTLVQDPFGNYVVQYILDLGEPTFSQPLAQSFLGNVAALSRQKFSSNVIEKSIRTGDEITRRALIDEIMNPADLEKLLRDSYANYVVQTAMDYADPETFSRSATLLTVVASPARSRNMTTSSTACPVPSLLPVSCLLVSSTLPLSAPADPTP
jgi:hypothetical protein